MKHRLRRLERLARQQEAYAIPARPYFSDLSDEELQSKVAGMRAAMGEVVYQEVLAELAEDQRRARAGR